MVVVNSSFGKNVAKHLNSTINNDLVINSDTDNMAAKAILICRQNSHHFNERTLTLDQPVKIGRSVARAKATSTNAIFDCKVLSRHHALLWYEDGKFYLQDTKSSNGTFVNNIRLSAETEHHELSSGDIVQFGVDVVENNRKVTHGCIVATLKLYLPDGKEAKASPSVTEGDRHGMVPLDDLYKLNQVIQEAKQREQCLESKLAALQRIIDETRKSADESWQAYVGEERLLSRVSALESQLQQASKNFGEDRIREELSKQQEHNEAYQIAAKEALEKVHAERLEAVAMATEQERARITAEQEALLAKEQLVQAQIELEEVAQKLTEEQKKAREQLMQLEERERELETKLDIETNKVAELSFKLQQLNALQDIEEIEKSSLIYNDVKTKEEILLGENEEDNSEVKENGIQNHITLSVRPVDESQTEKDDTNAPETTEEISEKTDTKHVHFSESDDNNSFQSQTQNGAEDTIIEEKNIGDSSEKGDYIDSKTLKYQFQSAQNELKQKIEFLESLASVNKAKMADLDKELTEERELSRQRLEENETLKEELLQFQQKWKESCNETQQLKDKLELLSSKLATAEEKVTELLKKNKEKSPEKAQKDKNNKLIPLQQLVNVEEELVLLKERFARVGDEKLKLQHELLSLTEQYKTMCNRQHNKHFFYVAPLVIMVLYLLVSAMIS